jgi:hypothetical protein
LPDTGDRLLAGRTEGLTGHHEVKDHARFHQGVQTSHHSQFRRTGSAGSLSSDTESIGSIVFEHVNYVGSSHGRLLGTISREVVLVLLKMKVFNESPMLPWKVFATLHPEYFDAYVSFISSMVYGFEIPTWGDIYEGVSKFAVKTS